MKMLLIVGLLLLGACSPGDFDWMIEAENLRVYCAEYGMEVAGIYYGCVNETCTVDAAGNEQCKLCLYRVPITGHPVEVSCST